MVLSSLVMVLLAAAAGLTSLQSDQSNNLFVLFKCKGALSACSKPTSMKFSNIGIALKRVFSP